MAAKTYHYFLSSGTFTNPSSISNCDFLAIGGGGAGCAPNGGGGGGGGFCEETGGTLPAVRCRTVTVGAGGKGGFTDSPSGQGSNGNSTEFNPGGMELVVEVDRGGDRQNYGWERHFFYHFSGIWWITQHLLLVLLCWMLNLEFTQPGSGGGTTTAGSGGGG